LGENESRFECMGVIPGHIIVCARKKKLNNGQDLWLLQFICAPMVLRLIKTSVLAYDGVFGKINRLKETDPVDGMKYAWMESRQ
jgi:hypothetical protein